MNRFLTRLLGRIPVGWLQLSHNRGRLIAAVAGVAFADILIFMQLGFLGAMIGSISLSYQAFNADLMISGSDMNTLDDGSPLPRQRMFEALSVQALRAPLRSTPPRSSGSSQTARSARCRPSESTRPLAPSGTKRSTASLPR